MNQSAVAIQRRGESPATVLKDGGKTTSPSTELLRRFLEAYWLRPENALWMTLRSLTLQQVEIAHSSIDIACGDGVFSFLHLGGRFDPAFDVFSVVDHLDQVRTQHADMFDAADGFYQPPIIQRPQDHFDIGADFKPAMLAKAAALKFYGRTAQQDGNEPLRFESNFFATVYCNAAYWVKNIEDFLRELARIVRDGGQIILQVKLDSMTRYTLSPFRAKLGSKFLSIIDRGRMNCWPTLCSRGTWESRFDHCGLNIVSATPFVTRTHSHFWDIGLRPIAPQLVRMANGLASDTRSAIKADWVDLFVDLLTPLCDPAFDLFLEHNEPAEIQYVLARK